MRNFTRFFLAPLFLATLYTQAIATADGQYAVAPLIFKSWFPAVSLSIQDIQIPLQLDLGAAKLELSLNPALLKKFKIKVIYTGKTRVISDSQGKKAVLKEFILPEAELSGVRIKNINAIETHPFPWGGPGEQPAEDRNGVIGLGLIAQFNIILSYKEATLILTKSNHYPAHYAVCKWRRFPFVLHEGNLVTEGNLGGKKMGLLWDTGSPFNMIKSMSGMVGKIKNCTPGVARSLGLPIGHCRGITTSLKISTHDFKKLTFYVYPMAGLPMQGILGAPFFKAHVVAINFRQHWIGVKP